MKRSKRYTSLEEINQEQEILDVVEAVKTNCTCKFAETLDIAFNLNILKKHTIRDIVVFPNKFGKEKRVLVFAKGEKAQEAKDAGAEHVGDDDLVEKIKGGWLEFDVAIATPDMMKSISSIARTLGTKGLMPNPKTQTVTNDIADAVKQVKAGRKEFRADANGVINMGVGKANMEKSQILENIKTLVKAVKAKEPEDIKGEYVKSAFLTSTMGKSVRLDTKALLKMK
jgi:large subunit ribosomal protein L1